MSEKKEKKTGQNKKGSENGKENDQMCRNIENKKRISKEYEIEKYFGKRTI